MWANMEHLFLLANRTTIFFFKFFLIKVALLFLGQKRGRWVGSWNVSNGGWHRNSQLWEDYWGSAKRGEFHSLKRFSGKAIKIHWLVGVPKKVNVSIFYHSMTFVGKRFCNTCSPSRVKNASFQSFQTFLQEKAK